MLPKSGQFETLRKMCDMVELMDDSKSSAAQILISSLCCVPRGYPLRATPVCWDGYPIRVNPYSRAWFDGPFCDKIPSEFSDRLLKYCLREGTEIAYLLSTGGESLILRNATPEQVEVLLKKLCYEEEESDEDEEKEKDEDEEKNQGADKKKRGKKPSYREGEKLVPQLIRLPAFKGKLLLLLESMKFRVFYYS